VLPFVPYAVHIRERRTQGSRQCHALGGTSQTPPGLEGREFRTDNTMGPKTCAFHEATKRVTHLRTDIESTAFPVSLGGEVRRQFSIVVIRNVFNDEHALLANSVDTQCAVDRRLIKWHVRDDRIEGEIVSTRLPW
jgi:hypothetical protein